MEAQSTEVFGQQESHVSIVVNDKQALTRILTGSWMLL
jgi:hypothetical protein